MELETEPTPASYRNAFQAPEARLGETVARTYSGIGLASLLLALLAGLGIFGAIGYAVYFQVKTGRAVSTESGQMIAIGLSVIGCMLVGVVGLVLGIVGLFQADRKKLLAVLGTVFNFLVFLMFGVLYAVGLSAT